MDGDIVNEDIPEIDVNLIPFINSFLQTPENDRLPFGKSHVVVISMFPPNGYHMGPHFGHGKTHSTERIGDDLGATARRNLKEGVAEPFDFYDA
jgi:hypothetical protein